MIPQSEHELSDLLEDAYCDIKKIPETRTESSSNKRRNNWCDNTTTMSQRNRCRPLPSTQSLLSNNHMNETMTTRISTASISSNHSSSLLRKFYKSIGTKAPSDDVTTTTTSDNTNVQNDKDDGEKPTREALDEIDDPSLSTLKIGYHRRYLKLTTDQQQSSRRTYAERKELKTLQQLLIKEQAVYRLALDKYHKCYKLRYMIGFGSDSLDKKTNRANAFCRWACKYAQAINREWKDNMLMVDSAKNNSKPHNNSNNHALPKRYGKVRQTLGLQSQARRPSLEVQDLTCSIVHESSPTSKLSSSLSSPSPFSNSIAIFSLKDCGISDLEQIPPPTMELTPIVVLLRNDKMALELAARHSVSIVTTSESLETLLQLPGEYSANWMFFSTKRSVEIPTSKSISSISVTILDIPLAQAFSSPRACLESGLQEGLYQSFQQQQQYQQEFYDNNVTTETDNEKKRSTLFIPSVIKYVYSLLTLPCKNIAGNNKVRQPIRVLIRTLVRLKDSTSKLPVRLRAHVEYHDLTSHRRKEIPNSYERSLWILDQVLFGHKVCCLQYRIDPTTCTILGWDATSIAHAFAVSASSDRKYTKTSPSTPLDHWESLIQLLQSIPSIDISDCLLCLPGRVGEKNVVNEISRGDFIEEDTITAIDNTDCDPGTQQQHQQVRIDSFSVSVHAPFEKTISGPITATIDFDKNILDQAGAVILGEQALQDCRREWEWNRPGQIPNTFPVIDKT